MYHGELEGTEPVINEKQQKAHPPPRRRRRRRGHRHHGGLRDIMIFSLLFSHNRQKQTLPYLV
jgi:hypothetical protein